MLDHEEESKLLPISKEVGYSVVIVGMLYAGVALGELVGVPRLRQTIETLPVLVCLIFVLRLPVRPVSMMSPVWRGVLLVLPVALLGFMDFEYPDAVMGRPHLLATVAVEALAIGVSEEVTFRFSLHRVWAQYSATFYVLTSSLIFGLLHYADGLQVVVVSMAIGVLFALARVAGMPIIVLIAFHGLIDAPGRVYALGVTT